MYEDKMHSYTEPVIAVFQSVGFAQSRTHLFETPVSWLTGESLWRQRHINHLVMMPRQIREFDLHNGAAKDHVFYFLEFKQGVYVVGDVARAVCAIPIVSNADVACLCVTTFSPNNVRRYPSCSPPMSTLPQTLPRFIPRYSAAAVLYA